ncbi:CGNR zinc finger domain-containing protein [Kitasatospora sp. HPMI-4]|uniref:CGNR zinc finger domain-containing protein n=1 Tax=Kitasatospora sp. HPMI-4 TaxID=3448443 RepID=UPI003F1AA1F9
MTGSPASDTASTRRPDPLPAAPGEDRSPALALVNTRTVRGGIPVDMLDTPEQVAAWLRIHTEAEAPPSLDADAVEGFHELRDAIRELLTAATDGREPEQEAVVILNAALRAAPAVPRLDWPAGGRPRRRDISAAVAPIAGALSRIAEDALGLLCGPEAEELAVCPADGCGRLLLRGHGRRQWCSTRCGDRVRAARYYARRRAAGSDRD